MTVSTHLWILSFLILVILVSSACRENHVKTNESNSFTGKKSPNKELKYELEGEIKSIQKKNDFDFVIELRITNIINTDSDNHLKVGDLINVVPLYQMVEGETEYNYENEANTNIRNIINSSNGEIIRAEIRNTHTSNWILINWGKTN